MPNTRVYYLMYNGSVRDANSLREELEENSGQHSPCSDETVVDQAILYGDAKEIGIDHKLHFDEAFLYLIATRQKIKAVMLYHFQFPEKGLADAKDVVDHWLSDKHYLDDKF